MHLLDTDTLVACYGVAMYIAVVGPSQAVRSLIHCRRGSNIVLLGSAAGGA